MPGNEWLQRAAVLVAEQGTAVPLTAAFCRPQANGSQNSKWAAQSLCVVAVFILTATMQRWH
jgi:hypothetical protein